MIVHRQSLIEPPLLDISTEFRDCGLLRSSADVLHAGGVVERPIRLGKPQKRLQLSVP